MLNEAMNECKGLETEQDPMGLLGTKTFLCPLFLACSK